MGDQECITLSNSQKKPNSKPVAPADTKTPAVKVPIKETRAAKTSESGTLATDAGNMFCVKLSNVVVDYPLVNISSRNVSINTQGASNETGSGRVFVPKRRSRLNPFPPHARVRALDHIDLNLKSGCAVGILGLNGSGKSTLLRTLGGLIVPSSGQISVEKDRLGIFSMRQGVRMEATGRRNITLRGQLLGFSPNEVEERIDAIAEFADLGPFLDLPLSSYSTGMTLRLSFAVCAAFKPRLLLLDEWIGTVDAAFQKKAQDWLIQFVEDGGSVLLASHSVGLLKSVCTSAILLEEGKLAMQSGLDDVIQEYRKIRADRNK